MAGERKVILFDLGGVLVGSTGLQTLGTLLPHLIAEGRVLERWQRSQAVNLFERGQISPDAFAAAFVREWGLTISEPAFVDEFARWVTGFFDGAQVLVRSLRARHHVGCLSNTNAIHWARLPEIPGLFDFCFASHLTGFMKPERAAYLHALDELDVRADEVYFFDDLAENVSAARDVGINAFRVTGFSALVPILRAEGLVSAPDA